MQNLEKEEEWLPVEGYEGLYEVSNLGNVKSLGKGKSNNSKERILKTSKDNVGYLIVSLYREGERKDFKVHRLVAKAFIENHLNLREINHRDENKENNAVENLEWCDRKYNINYGTRTERISKKVKQFSLEGEFVKEFPSIREVQRQLGFAHSNIGKCCNGKYKQAYGYIWRYVE